MTVLELLLRRLVVLCLAIVAAMAVWSGLLSAFDVSPLISRTPLQVLSYLTEASGTAEGLALKEALLETIRDFSLGYSAGLVAAFGLAVLFCLSSTIERIMMPTTMMVRAIPVIVLAPLITLVFGIGLGGVTAIVVVVVFFPSLANVLVGLREAQGQYGDLVQAYRGSTVRLLTTAVLPGAIPSIMASARIAIPAAAAGAMIGEWLATGDGIGGYISRSVSSFHYDVVWSGAALVTLFAMLVYTVVDVLDRVARSRFSPNDE